MVAGQYFGIGFLTALSVFGAWGTQIFPPKYIGLLGFLPLVLGIRAWINYRRERNEGERNTGNRAQISFFSVAMLTIANGADNIGVYIPIFSGYSLADFVVTLAVFAVMIALWCYLGFALVNYPYIRRKIVRYQHILVPLVLIALGLFILAKNYIF